MNIVSVLVGVSIAGIATPQVVDMSLQPIYASKRAQNFAVAESTAVGYAAMNEGLGELTPLPDNCTTAELDGNAYTITCTHGEGRFKQSVSRSFRLAAICEDGNNGHGNDNCFWAVVSSFLTAGIAILLVKVLFFGDDVAF